MADRGSTFRGSFSGPNEAALHRGRRPVIFDVLAPDQETSLLDMVEQDLRLVLHVNPRSMQFSYKKQIDRTQTRSGWVEFHWGDGPQDCTFAAATGGFMRLYSGLSNTTGSGSGAQGRRETLAYDKYLDLLSLFHSNGAIYDAHGNIAVQGYIQMTFDGGIHQGWFDGEFSVAESSTSPFMFELSTRFIIDREVMLFRSSDLAPFSSQATFASGFSDPEGSPSTTILDEIVDPFRSRTGAGSDTGAMPINPFDSSSIVDPFRSRR